MKYVKADKRKNTRIKIKRPEIDLQNDVEEMYLHKGWMLMDFAQEILSKIKGKKNDELKIKIVVYISTGAMETDDAKEHIMISFLEDLEKQSLIKNLSCEFVNQYDEPSYTEATFWCNSNKLRQTLQKFHLVLKMKSEKADFKTFKKDFFLQNGFFFWRTLKIPAGSAHGPLLAIFLENPTILSGNTEVRKGKSISMEDLESVTGYKDKRTLRDALTEVRRKLTTAQFPVSIDNVGLNQYVMKIRYPTA